MAGGARAIEGSGGAAQASSPATIEVLVRHAIRGTEIRLLLPRRARYKHIKKALSRLLTLDEAARSSCKLTRKVRGVYRECLDEQRLGDVRAVLVIGVDLAAAADGCGRLDERDVSGDDAAEIEEEVELGPVKETGGEKKSRQEAVMSEPARRGGLTRLQAIQLQRDLLKAFEEDAFQQKLARLKATHLFTPNSAEFQQDRQELFLAVQSRILPSYGFPGTQEGVFKMMAAMGPFVKDPEYVAVATRTNELLGWNCPPEMWDSLATSFLKLTAEAQPASEVRRPQAPTPVAGRAGAGFGAHATGLPHPSRV